jgi:hypothetical protein
VVYGTFRKRTGGGTPVGGFGLRPHPRLQARTCESRKACFEEQAMARDNRLAAIERKLEAHTYLLWVLTMMSLIILWKV